MFKKYISLALVFLGTAVIAGCSIGIVFAQEVGGDAPPPPPSDSGGGMPPPPYQGGGGGTMFTPPPYDSRGDFEPPRIQPPPSGGIPQGGMMQPPNGEMYRQEQIGTEMQKQRMEQQQFGRPEGNDPRMMGSWGESGGENNYEDIGPSSEEMEKRQVEQEKRMRTEQLRQMRRGINGLEQGLKQVKRMMERLSKKGIAIPSEATSLMAELTAALEKVKSATEFTDEVEAAMELIQDKGQDLGELGQRFGMLEQFSQMTKQVEKEFARIDKDVAKAKKRKEATQYPEIITKIDAQVIALKDGWGHIKSGISSGDADPDDLRDTMETIFEDVGEVRRAIGFLQQLGSIAKMVKSAEKEIVGFEKAVNREEKAKKDVSRLRSLLTEAKTKLGEIKALAKQSNADPEDFFDLMQELERMRVEAVDELDRVSGKSEVKQLSGAVIQALVLRRLGL